MEKLTIEQKAMAYDKAIKVANKYKDTSIMFPSIQDEMFPELKESEDANEKVRKALIKLVTNHASMDLFIEYDIHLDEALSWLEKQGEKVTSIEGFETEFERQVSHLIASVINREHEYNEGFVKWSANALLNYAKHELEKQGEQKSTDKTEPKFKVGDWIVYKDNIWKICNISLGAYYELLKVDGEVIIRHFEGVDKTAHLWTVKDAKDGDVLVGGEQVFLFKRMDTSNSFYAHCNYHFIGYDSLSVYDCSYSIDNICPATKKQRDVLMKAIADAGYAFDFEKKELKKIEQKPQHIVSAEAMNDKNAWSEKDEKMLNGVILDLTFLKCEANSNEGKKAYQREIDLLKSLKDKQEWNEDDKRRFNGIIADVETMKEQAFNIGAKVAYQKEIDWLKDKVQPQPKQEWSEEDEYHKRQILRILKDNGCSQTLQERTEKWIEERLKSPRPQAQWKPTDKQMCNLSYAAHHHCAFFDTEILKGLYDDLKKL